MEGCTRFSKLATYLPTENGEGAPFSRRAGEGDETFQPAETGAFIPYFWSQSAQTRQFFHALPRAHGAVPKFIPVQGYTGPPLSAFMSSGCTMTSVVRSKCLGRSSEDITMHYLQLVRRSSQKPVLRDLFAQNRTLATSFLRDLRRSRSQSHFKLSGWSENFNSRTYACPLQDTVKLLESCELLTILH